MRLIDADALKTEISEEQPLVHFGPFGYAGCSPDSQFGEKVFMRERVLQIIDSSPTVDAIEVVRCKDCRFRDPEDGCCDHPMSTILPIPRKPEGFCSCGERRKNAKAD